MAGYNYTKRSVSLSFMTGTITVTAERSELSSELNTSFSVIVTSHEESDFF